MLDLDVQICGLEGTYLVASVATADGVQELARYWEKEFDWRKAEAHINSFANYDMEVNGIAVGCPSALDMTNLNKVCRPT